jgi:hypothetical protein
LASLFSVGIELTGEFCPNAGADAIQNASTKFRFRVGGKTALGVARYALVPFNHTACARTLGVGLTTVRFLVNYVAFWQYRLMARVTSKNSAPNGSALGFEPTLWSVAEKLKGKLLSGNLRAPAIHTKEATK